MQKIPQFLEPQQVDGCIAVALSAGTDWYGNVFAGSGARVMSTAFVRNAAPSAILPGDWPEHDYAGNWRRGRGLLHRHWLPKTGESI